MKWVEQEEAAREESHHTKRIFVIHLLQCDAALLNS